MKEYLGVLCDKKIQKKRHSALHGSQTSFTACIGMLGNQEELSTEVDGSRDVGCGCMNTQQWRWLRMK